MLLQTMTQTEITKEIREDYSDVCRRSLERLRLEFEKTIKKTKGLHRANISSIYQIKSKRKNPWLLIFSKDHNNKFSFNCDLITYYLTDKDLRFFEIDPGDNHITAYNSHLFQRYNERMGLNFPDTLSAAKEFFMLNNERIGAMMDKDEEGKQKVIEISTQGFILGEVQNEWYVYKTFISHELKHKEQSEIELQALRVLSDRIIQIKNGGEVDTGKLKLFSDLTNRYLNHHN